MRMIIISQRLSRPLTSSWTVLIPLLMIRKQFQIVFRLPESVTRYCHDEPQSGARVVTSWSPPLHRDYELATTFNSLFPSSRGLWPWDRIYTLESTFHRCHCINATFIVGMPHFIPANFDPDTSLLGCVGSFNAKPPKEVWLLPSWRLSAHNWRVTWKKRSVAGSWAASRAQLLWNMHLGWAPVAGSALIDTNRSNRRLSLPLPTVVDAWTPFQPIILVETSPHLLCRSHYTGCLLYIRWATFWQ